MKLVKVEVGDDNGSRIHEIRVPESEDDGMISEEALALFAANPSVDSQLPEGILATVKKMRGEAQPEKADAEEKAEAKPEEEEPANG